MLGKINRFDSSKDLITSFILIDMIGVSIIILMSTEIGIWSYQFAKYGVKFSVCLDKMFIFGCAVMLMLYALFQIYISRKAIHSRVMTFGFIGVFAYVYLLVWKGIIIGYTSSGLLILISVGLIMSYVNLLHKI